MELKKDIWRPFIVHAEMDTIIRQGNFAGFQWTALPASRSLAYTADPFGLWRDDHLHVFVETFDYREGHGRIACHVFDRRFSLIETRTVLAEPWHLSYPVVFEAGGATWMMPEACASGYLTLYRARSFPFDWVPECRIELDVAPIDATPVQWRGKWWLFYAPAGTPEQRLTHLHVACAEQLGGPWVPDPASPILIDPKGVRPGGTVTIEGDALRLPVQDCSHSYGSGLRILTIKWKVGAGQDGQGALDIADGATWTAPHEAGPYCDGLHTMSSAGSVTLVDVKNRRFSLNGLTMRPRRMLDHLFYRR